jgi:hypothetical protein
VFQNSLPREARAPAGFVVDEGAATTQTTKYKPPRKLKRVSEGVIDLTQSDSDSSACSVYTISDDEGDKEGGQVVSMPKLRAEKSVAEQ